MAVDWTDPCARLAALQGAYYNLISGQSESLVRYKGPEGEREVRFAIANLDDLRAEIQVASAACAVVNGQPDPGRRYSIRGRGRRRPYPLRGPYIAYR
jgi:gpW